MNLIFSTFPAFIFDFTFWFLIYNVERFPSRCRHLLGSLISTIVGFPNSSLLTPPHGPSSAKMGVSTFLLFLIFSAWWLAFLMCSLTEVVNPSTICSSLLRQGSRSSNPASISSWVWHQLEMVLSYKARILQNGKSVGVIPISDTDTFRIQPDTYPSILLFLKNILSGYSSDTFKSFKYSTNSFQYSSYTLNFLLGSLFWVLLKMFLLISWHELEYTMI